MDLVTLACRLASPGAGEWGCLQDLTHSRGLCPHVGLWDLVNLVLTWSSPRHGDSGHQLGLTWTW